MDSGWNAFSQATQFWAMPIWAQGPPAASPISPTQRHLHHTQYKPSPQTKRSRATDATSCEVTGRAVVTPVERLRVRRASRSPIGLFPVGALRTARIVDRRRSAPSETQFRLG